MVTQASLVAKAEDRRWWILGVLCFSLLVIVLDNSILNVAIPTLQRDLSASNSELQWMVNSYTLVFAGLLLTAGSLGDRFGRKRALQFGFGLFGIGSVLAAISGSAGELITTRAFMGIGGAFIMPATLSIITNVFPSRDRAKAIGVWAATAGVGVALGPLIGGLLLEHFYWGSIFLVNIPIVAAGVVAGIFLIPESRDPAASRLDPGGAVLSIIALTALLYAVIEAPREGWTSSTILVAFGIGGVLLVAFFLWEARSAHPMLDLGFFRNARFSAASGAISVTFFAMFGSIFLLTQYLQLVLGFSPLETGVRLLAFAIPMMIFAPLSAKFVERLGAKVVVTTGLTLMALGLYLFAGLDASSGSGAVVWRMAIAAVGMALTMAPSTDSIMGSLPLAKAGIGSAMNDTTRQVGGAVGVAVIGSIFSSVYASKIVELFSGAGLPAQAIDAAKESLGAALTFARNDQAIAGAAKDAFVEGFHSGLWVAAGAAAVGAFAVARFLPARARSEDVERQHAEYEQEWGRSDAEPAPTAPLA